jgi:Fe-S-cluster containining protein
VNPPEFICNGCGKCCTGGTDDLGVLLLPDDISRIADYLNLNPDEFVEKCCDGRPFPVSSKLEMRQLRTEGGRCIFLRTDNLCAIHDVKPLQCETGPFGMFWDGELRYECMRQLPKESIQRAKAETVREFSIHFSRFRVNQKPS